MTKVILKESVADFTAAEENLENIRTFLRDRLIETPLAKKEITGLLLAVEEAISNIIRHGYLYAPGNVRLRIAHDRRRVTISIVDTGRAFEWPRKGSVDYQKMVETSRKGGLGLVLIERVCDRVDYHRTPVGENELTLTKNFQSSRRAGKGLSLRWKGAAVGMAVSTAAAIAFFVIASTQGGRRIGETYFANWINLARSAASASSNLIINRVTDAEFDELALNLARPDPTVEYLVITEMQGIILADTRRPENVRTKYKLPAGLPSNLYDSPQLMSGGAASRYYLTSPVLVGRRMVGRVHLETDGAKIEADRTALRARLALYAAGGMVLFWALAILLSGWLVQPLKRLSGSIRSGSGRGFEKSLPVRGGNEIQEIIDAFNSAADQIHQGERAYFSRELARREWEVAEQLQKALIMSQPPEIPGYEIGTIYRSAKYVGGDWFDVFPIDDCTFVVSVADVSGKGVPGALVMATVRTAVRLLAEKHREPPALLSAVNRFASGNLRSGMFVTIFLAIVDTRSSTVCFASAGHTPMLFFRREEKKMFELNPRGWPLGMQLPEGVSFDERLESGNLPLELGDIFVLYTDGISETRNARNQLLGAERLKGLIAGKTNLSADQISQAILDEITEFAGNGPLQDDIAAVVVKRTHEVPARPDSAGPRMVVSDFEIDSAARALWNDDDADSLTKMLLQVVVRHPEFDPPQICLELGRNEYNSLQIDEHTVSSRLLHLQLDDRRSRLDFADWAHALQDD